MRILQVSQTHPPEFSGGSTVYAVMLSEELAKRGFSVDFFCNTQDRSLLPYELHSAPAELYRIIKMGLPRRWYGKEHVRKVAEVTRKLLAQLKVDIVHVHSTLGLGEGVLLAANAEGIPSVVTTHEGMWICPNLYFRNTWTGRICSNTGFAKCLFCMCRPGEFQQYRLDELPRVIARAVKYNNWVLNHRKSYLSLADHVIACCWFIKDKYREFGLKRPISVVKNRIDETEILFKPIRAPRKPITFGALGPFRPKKGGELLIKALSIIGDRKDRFEFHVWGSVHPEMSQQVRSLHSERHIQMHGPYDRSDLNEILSRIDVLVYPSCSGDTYPLVLIEALASRTPIIAARTHGMAEIVKDGVNGRFFEPLNPSSLANAILSFIENPEIIMNMQQHITPPPPYSGLVDANVAIYTSLTRSGKYDPGFIKRSAGYSAAPL